MFSVGVLYAAQEFLELVRDTAEIDLRFPDIFRSFSVASPKAVLAVSQQCEWVQLNVDGHLEITERGNQILQCKEMELALRIQLGHLIETYLPTWIPLFSRGRTEARKYLPADVVQCLSEAGLFVGTSDDIVNWWDRYARVSRRTNKDANLDVGRRGEKLSLRYERTRTKREPIWQSLESNFAGYDILSVISDNDSMPLKIEVKTTSSTAAAGILFVTRNEWQVAASSDQYLFHLWCLKPRPHLTIVEAARLESHLPANRGSGTWETVSLPYSSFVTDDSEAK